MQPTDNVTHLFGIAMSIFKIMVIQAKIRHFAHTVFIEEDVACGQITMNNLTKSRQQFSSWSRPWSAHIANERLDLASKNRNFYKKKS